MGEFDDLLYLSRDDMNHVALGARDMVDGIVALCRGKEAGRVHTAPKSSVKPDDDRFYISTLGATDDPAFMAVKSLGVSASNAERGLESMGSLITVHDGTTGHPLAVMDGDWITAVRTAALTGTAARYLARSEAAVIAFIGCGVQARSHLDLFAQLYPLTEIRAVGRGAKNRDALCAKAEGMGLAAGGTDDAAEAMAGADLIITSVPDYPGLEPFLDAADVAPGAFIGMVDLARTWRPAGLADLDRIFVDDRKQEAAMTTPMIDPAFVAGDLQDLVSGRAAGRTADGQRTAFAFRGMAIGDLALAIAVYQCARDAGLGRTLPR